ncbi:MAG: AzlD domain-containing protein [Lachnospiraceae bacterium]|nr:AzlD domain-containing protein [Lachnospiraceae bacterium]
MSYTFILILIMALITIALRALPFLIFTKDRKTPAYIIYLGKVLPQAVIGMLVIYCLKDISPRVAPFGLPEILAAAAVALLQVWRRNAVLSILGGTAIYMVLVQVVF